ncbi:hypothetical protein BTHE68_51360 [Burkholderia sp. THE68]|uniref:hypothetical protein n=1 Tax=Burkholderia sp. THE68 TaxID=758782 RepID=UPI001317BE36|nr:hypothetical protein [Burkholderia sp. THE68]BBU31396.1 hypothetical protein BTHE68_51300 [Burkholderia sp. THE68]BBU31402.1 hypothetical protein BTHE68_51360 [Burkholderia sp. THE68]
MSKTAEEQWQELCEEWERARDAYTNLMANRNPGVYQDGNFWEEMDKVRKQQDTVEQRMDEFKKKYFGS